MPEMARDRLTSWDWTLLGHDIKERGKLPTRRLDVPLPETVGGLHELAHMLAGLSGEIGKIARLTEDAPTAVRSLDGLLYSYRMELKRRQKEWEIIIQERERPAPEIGCQEEQSKSASGTTEIVDLGRYTR